MILHRIARYYRDNVEIPGIRLAINYETRIKKGFMSAAVTNGLITGTVSALYGIR